jgi:hypothetical protein
MIMMRRSIAAGVLLVAVAGCHPGSRLEVKTITTTTSSITVTVEGQAQVENAVRTEGKDTVITFRGKTVIVRNLIGYTALITPTTMKVEVGTVVVAFDERELSVTTSDCRMVLTLWKEQDGQRMDMIGGRKVTVSDAAPYVQLEGQ